MGRYSNNIRRIAQTDELKEQIRQSGLRLTELEKASIPGGRGIAYGDSLQAGSPGSTNPDKNGSPRLRNPGDKNDIESGGMDDTSVDVDSILNGSRVLEPGEDPGALEFKDCETGDDIDVRLNSGSNPGEAKFKHPPGWEIDGTYHTPGWAQGYMWTLLVGSGYLDDTPGGTMDAYMAVLNAGIAPDAYWDRATLTFVEGTTAHAVWYESEGAPPNNTTIIRSACVVQTGVTCPTEDPDVPENWQAQDPDWHHQLVFSAEDGGFVSSSKDGNIPFKFRNDVGSGRGLNNVKLCTAEDEHVVVSALTDGSFAMFQEDGFGFPEENAKIFHFDSEGKFQDTIRPDEYNYLRTTNNPAAG